MQIHKLVLVIVLLGLGAQVSVADAPIRIWPGLAPGETSEETGEALPKKPNEKPPVTRVVKIRQPTMQIFLPEKPNGAAILVLPGGGFSRVVPDMEGSEAAPWLTELGIACFVLSYRTNEVTPKTESVWKRPLQDSQRALRVIRSRAQEWKINPKQLGVLAFSAGGQVGSILHTRNGKADYESQDEIDSQSCQPDFSLLVYPWRILDASGEKLLPEIQVNEKTPPAFIVHTHDDNSSSLGSVFLYADHKRHNRPAELHVYNNGGHGYGMRSRKGSEIGTWPARATDWLRLHKYADE